MAGPTVFRANIGKVGQPGEGKHIGHGIWYCKECHKRICECSCIGKKPSYDAYCYRCRNKLGLRQIHPWENPDNIEGYY